MFVSTNSTYDETYEYNRFCHVVDHITANNHNTQKLIIVLDNNKITCTNSLEKTICAIKNVDSLLALEIQFHLQKLNFQFTEYSPKHFKAIFLPQEK